MLSPADDYLIHQTPEPLRYVFTSDRRFFDRYFFVGMSKAGDAAFLIGMGAYPNLGVIDGFASFSHGSKLVTVRGSRAMTHDRLDTNHVGPLGIQVIEGLAKFGLQCADTDGIGYDLTWTAAFPAFEEPPTYRRFGGRTVEQASRIIQSGAWAGTVTLDGATYDVNPDSWVGGRDHSWGVRASGLEPEPPGLYEAMLELYQMGVWIWSPMQFESHTLHFNVMEHVDGTREIATGRRMGPNGNVESLGGLQHSLRFDPETHALIEGVLSFLDDTGRRREISVTPLRSCYLFGGIGYGGPDSWRHGKYMGPTWQSSVEFDLSDISVLRQMGQVEHAMCRLELDDGEIGYGTVEVIMGATSSYGKQLDWTSWEPISV